jgi:hypothetical protein
MWGHCTLSRAEGKKELILLHAIDAESGKFTFIGCQMAESVKTTDVSNCGPVQRDTFMTYIYMLLYPADMFW